MKQFLIASTHHNDSGVEHHQIEFLAENKGKAYAKFRECFPDREKVIVNYIIELPQKKKEILVAVDVSENNLHDPKYVEDALKTINDFVKNSEVEVIEPEA